MSKIVETRFTREDIRESYKDFKKRQGAIFNVCPVARVATRLFGTPYAAGCDTCWDDKNDRYKYKVVGIHGGIVQHKFDDHINDMTPDKIYKYMVRELGGTKIKFIPV